MFVQISCMSVPFITESEFYQQAYKDIKYCQVYELQE
jgi:hypothetical protein